MSLDRHAQMASTPTHWMLFVLVGEMDVQPREIAAVQPENAGLTHRTIAEKDEVRVGILERDGAAVESHRLRALNEQHLAGIVLAEGYARRERYNQPKR